MSAWFESRAMHAHSPTHTSFNPPHTSTNASAADLTSDDVTLLQATMRGHVARIERMSEDGWLTGAKMTRI